MTDSTDKPTGASPSNANNIGIYALCVIAGAAIGVVAMGGYNTFCEILSFDKRALIVPRTVPRLEQYIRASRAQSLGLVAMLEDDDVHDPRTMITALRHLPQQRRPSEVIVPGLLDGLDNVNRLVALLLDRKRRPGNGSATRQRVALTP